jgi:hypothetical protein
LKTAGKFFLLFMPLWAALLSAQAEAQITTVPLGPETIATIRSSVGNTTRVVFPEPIDEIVCGDLYDEASGKGTFVILKGENDFFIKPVVAKGQSNMFVKTAGKKKTYNFKLEVVPANQAHFTVNVVDLRPAAPSPENPAQPANGNPGATPCITEADLEKRKAEIEQAGQLKADEIIRKARDEANRITNEAETRVAELNRKASDNAPQLSERRFIQTLLAGVQRLAVNTTRGVVRKVSITLDPEIYVFDGKAYLRYTIHNTSDKDFLYTAIGVETGAPKALQPIPVELTQSKSENTLAPTETLSGVITFDARLITPKDKIVFLIRGEEQVELLRLNIQ